MRTGNKVAQQNLRDRITSVFGPDATLDTYETENSYNVIVRLPLVVGASPRSSSSA